MKIIASLLLILVFPCWAVADSPIQIVRVERCSEKGQFCIVSDPAEDVTKVISKADGKLRWKVPGWHPWIFVSDNGLYGAIGYDGMNLVPVNVSLSEVAFHVYRDGVLAKKLLLSDLYKDVEQMPLTSSHRAWMKSAYFSEEDRFVVELIDGSFKQFEMDEK